VKHSRMLPGLARKTGFGVSGPAVRALAARCNRALVLEFGPFSPVAVSVRLLEGRFDCSFHFPRSGFRVINMGVSQCNREPRSQAVAITNLRGWFRKWFRRLATRYEKHASKFLACSSSLPLSSGCDHNESVT
jgi:hypothetical protein